MSDWSAQWVLSIAKLRVGQEAYQLSGVAQSLDDYYTGAGEAPGLWLGTAAERLGLDGEVAPDDLRAVLAGIAPASGGLDPNSATIKPHPRRVPGFDLTFKAPKSLSVLYAVSDDPRVQGAIIEACEAALRDTLGWLEREAIRVRRGSGDERRLADLAARDPEAASKARVQVLPATGVAAAGFRHRTSRAGDPLLHWHVLVPNLVEGPDGRWSAFVHPELYRHARAAGEVFQTAVRAEVSTRLGLEWRPGRHVPEVAGVPQWLCDLFSRRAKEIEAWLAATGLPADPAGRQQAVLATRKGKPEREGERFDASWKAEALAAGWGPDAAEELIASLTPATELPVEARWRLPERTTGPDGDPLLHDTLVEPDEWARAVLESDLTYRDATFTRPQLVQLIAARLGDGATVATIQRITDRVLASSHVIPLHQNNPREPARWTSSDHTTRERRLLATVDSTRGTRDPISQDATRSAIEARPTLGDDQAAAVGQLTASTDALTVLVGPAGTGKTYTLDTIRDTYQRAGYTVIGAAPSARAALELASGARVPARTLHRLLTDWANGIDTPNEGTVLVIDEAAMAGTRELEPAVRTVIAAGGRVLLAGDHHQLPAVTAGGAFAALIADNPNAAATLTLNRRQTAEWERGALAQLRDGHVARAVSAYMTHDRVVVTEDRADMILTAIDRWFDARDAGHQAVLLAGTNDLVDALNNAVRRELVTRGELPAGPALAWGDRDFTVGDRVVIRRNSYDEQRLDGTGTAILNGEVGTVVDGGPDGLLIRSDLDNGTVIVRGAYIAGGNLDYAYALTTNRAQGGTWDIGIGVGLDGLYQEAGYTQLSRGRHANWIILNRPELADIDAELDRHDKGIPLPSELPADVETQLVSRLEYSRAKVLALTRDPHADHISHLADAHTLDTLEQRATRCRSIEAQATQLIGTDPRGLGAQAARAQHAAERVAPGLRIKAHDRGNIGTITFVNDQNGTVDVHFRSPDGRVADKELAWDEIEVLDPNTPCRLIPDAAKAHLEEKLAPIRAQLQRWHNHLTEHGVGPLDAEHHERAAELLVDRNARHLAYQQPDWLDTLIRTRPERPAAANVWDEALRHIAAYRSRHHIHEATAGIGPPPDLPHDHRAWATTAARVTERRLWLDTHSPRPLIPITRARSLQELLARRLHLDHILDAAPDDQRTLISRLRSSPEAVETTQLLEQALQAQGERATWILEHWPHIVEHAEITRAIDENIDGSPIGDHLDTLALHPHPMLAHAARDSEPWLLNAISHLVPPGTPIIDAPTIDAPTIDVLTRVADYRHRWGISTIDLLGTDATDSEQARELDLLSNMTRSLGEETRSIESRDVEQPHVDDSLGL